MYINTGAFILGTIFYVQLLNITFINIARFTPHNRKLAKYNTIMQHLTTHTSSFVHLRISEAGMVHVVADTGRQQ